MKHVTLLRECLKVSVKSMEINGILCIFKTQIGIRRAFKKPKKPRDYLEKLGSTKTKKPGLSRFFEKKAGHFLKNRDISRFFPGFRKSVIPR